MCLAAAGLEREECAATGSEVGGLGPCWVEETVKKGATRSRRSTGQKRGVDHASLPLPDDACAAFSAAVLPIPHRADEEATAKRRGRVVDSVGALTAERPVLITSSVVGKTNRGDNLKQRKNTHVSPKKL